MYQDKEFLDFYGPLTKISFPIVIGNKCKISSRIFILESKFYCTDKGEVQNILRRNIDILQ